MTLDMDTPQVVMGVVALFVPVIVRYVKNATWIPVYGKYLIAFLTSLVVAVVTTVVQGGFVPGELATNLAVVLAAQQLAYEAWWRKELE